MALLRYEVDFPEEMFEMEQKLYDVKVQILEDTKNEVARAQSEGILPKDSNDYWLILKNKGSEQRRQLSTINASFLKIGTERSPLEFRFYSKVVNEYVVKAAREAYIMVKQRAPVVSGNYRKLINVNISDSNNKNTFAPTNQNALKRLSLLPTTTIQIRGNAEYSSTLEYGFYKKYYKTRKLPGGIFRYVARRIRKRYGGKVAVRFIYIGNLNGVGGGTGPCIEIGPPGSIPEKDAVPGSAKRRRARRKK